MSDLSAAGRGLSAVAARAAARASNATAAWRRMGRTSLWDGGRFSGESTGPAAAGSIGGGSPSSPASYSEIVRRLRTQEDDVLDHPWLLDWPRAAAAGAA